MPNSYLDPDFNPFIPASVQSNPFLSKPDEAEDNPFIPASFSKSEAQPSKARGITAPKTAFGKTLDFVSRGVYASAKFADVLVNDKSFNIGGALSAAAQEAKSPVERLSYRDVLAKLDPEFAGKPGSGAALATMGFILDVALDPVTYVSFGASTGLRVLGKAGVKTLAPKAGAKLVTAATKREAAKGLTGFELAKSVEEKVAAVATAHPERYLDKGGIKFAGKTVVPGSLIDDLGIGQLKERIKSLQLSKEVTVGDVISTRRDAVAKHLRTDPRRLTTADLVPGVPKLKSTISRNAYLPDEYVQARKGFEANLLEAERDVRTAALKMFGDFDPVQRQQIGKLGLDIQEATRVHAENLRVADLLEAEKLGDTKAISRLKKPGSRPLLPAEAALLRREMVNASGLSEAQKDAYTSMQSALRQVSVLERQAGLLEQATFNYSPQRYHALKSAKQFIHVSSLTRKKLKAMFTPDQHVKFKTIKEAQEAGFDPVYDAATLYTVRMLESKQAFARQLFDSRVEKMYPGYKQTINTIMSGGKVSGIPLQIAKDIRYVGDGLYSKGTMEEINAGLKLYDFVMQGFRKAATVLKPSFGVRQAVSNPLQSFLLLGKGALDPRTMGDAVQLMTNPKGPGFEIVTRHGERISKGQFAEEIGQYGIVRNVTVEGIGREGTITSIRNARQIERVIDSARQNKRWRESGAAVEGLGKALKGVAKYTEWPSKVEDLGRIAMYMNARKAGHGPGAAARMVDESLFDYMNGLSALEQRIARRIVPFYSFQRFAIPLLAKSVFHTPGRPLSIAKGVEGFFTAWNKLAGGEELSPSERQVKPDWLWEQPHAFHRFDDAQKAVFKTFNNFTMMDVFNFIELDDNGDFDLLETSKKGIMAQITPFVKVPLEIMSNEDYFTGQVINPERDRKSKEGPLDPDKFFSNLMAVVGASTRLGGVGAAAGKAAGAALATTPINETMLKQFLGWEEGVDRNGKRQVWMNPYIMHVATSFYPALAEAVKGAKDDRHPIEKAQQTLLGIGTLKLDLKQQESFKRKELMEEKARLVSELRKAQRENRASTYDAAKQDLDELMEEIQKQYESMSGPIRGEG